MATLVNICLGVIWLAVAMLLSLDLAKFKLSKYDLSQLSTIQRKSLRGQVALNLQEIYKLTQIKLIFFGSLFIVILTWHRSWVGSLVIAILSLIAALLISQVKLLGNLTQRILVKILPQTLVVIKYIKPALNRLKGLPVDDKSFKSQGELLDLIARDETVLQPEQRKLLAHALQFAQKPVRTNMVSRAGIVSVKLGDTLGPKLIDNLHNSGYSRFPVIKNSLDNIVGTLYLQDLRDISALESGPKAKDLMRPQVYFIHESAVLGDALNAFLSTNHQQLFVVNSRKKVIGLISLEDLLEQMIGQTPSGDFDQYDDIEAVVSAATEDIQETEE